jgi:DNA polymerase-1
LRSVEDLGAPKYDEEIAEYTKGKDGSFANIPKDLLYKYNAYDVCCTWDLNELFDIQMSPKQHRLHEFLIEAVNELMHIELEGIDFDLEYNDRLAIEYVEKLEKSEVNIQNHVGYALNPRSYIQILLYFANFGLILPTTQREFLEKLRDELDGELQEFVDLLLDNRNLTKTFGTYIKGLRRKVKNGKVYTTFSLHGTTSGRLASKNPNLQNIKREKAIRNQFTAAPGRMLVQADYSQVEGRTICILAQDEYLRTIFSDAGKDIFNDMCNNIWGPGNWDKENRVSIKSIFYGFAYGRKAKSIARELDKPVEYAHNLMAEFKKLIPSVVAWQAEIKHRVLSGEDLETPFGRKRTFHLITNDNKEDVLNEALSYLPQSIASDICLRAAVRLRPILRREFDAGIKLLIHDAIVVECDPSDTDAVINRMIREMERSGEEFSDYVPFRVDAKANFRLGEL